MTEKSYLAIHGMCVIFLPISPHFVISSTLYIFSLFYDYNIFQGENHT